MEKSTDSESGAQTSQDIAGNKADVLARPAYTKPAIRKYNQIVQVKPYGPSEKEAG
jgi:hypothetical protein